MKTLSFNKEQVNDVFQFTSKFGKIGFVKLIKIRNGRYSLASNDKQGEVFSGGANGDEGYEFGWINEPTTDQHKILFTLPPDVVGFEYIFPKADNFNYKLYFANRSEYRELFSNGRNKLFLATLKTVYKNKKVQELFTRFIKDKEDISNAKLLSFLDCLINVYSVSKKYTFNLFPDFAICTDFYGCDNNNGRCTDGDVGAVRYIKVEDGKTYKMKIGKWMNGILTKEYADVINAVGNPLINYFLETVITRWKATGFSGERYELQTEKEGLTFEHIYSTDTCVSKLGSCMMDDCQFEFYDNSVNAQPVALYDKQIRKFVCRAVIFNDVKDANGKTYRYLERQYGQTDLLKQVLIDACYKANLIDIHKSAMAGYSDVTEVYDRDNKKIESFLQIDIHLEPNDVLSFQDTFRYYDIDKKKGYNIHEDGADHRLDVTDCRFYAGEWDEYNQEYTTDSLTTVNVWTGHHYNEQTVSVDYADSSFQIYENEYYDELYHSDIMDEEIPLDMVEELEQAYKERNWNFDEYNNEYTESGLTTVFVVNGTTFINQDVSIIYAQKYLLYNEDADAYFVNEQDAEDYLSIQITEKETNQ